MKKIVAAAVFATLLIPPALAGSFDPDRAKQGLSSVPTPAPAPAAPNAPAVAAAPAAPVAPAVAAPAPQSISSVTPGCVAHLIPLQSYRSANKDLPGGFVPQGEEGRLVTKMEELQDKGTEVSDFKADRYTYNFGAHTKAGKGIGRAAYKIRCSQKVFATGDYAYSVTIKTPDTDTFYGSLPAPAGMPAGASAAKGLLPPGYIHFPYVIDVRVGLDEGSMTSILHKAESPTLAEIDGQPITPSPGTYTVSALRFIDDATKKPADKVEVEIFVALDTFSSLPSSPYYPRSNQDKIVYDLSSFTIAVRGPNDHSFAPPTNSFYHEIQTEAGAVPAAPVAPAAPAVVAPGAAAQPQPAATTQAPAVAPAAPVAPIAPAQKPTAPTANLPALGGSTAAAAPAAGAVAAANTAGAGGAGGAAKTAPQQPDRLVKVAQERLNELGYDAGTADGFLGPKTTASVKRFQEATGLSPTGKIDEAVLEKIYQANKGAVRLDYGNALGAAGLPNTFLSKLTRAQIDRLRFVVAYVLDSRNEFQGPFPFTIADGGMKGNITATGSTADACRTFKVDANLPNGARGASSGPQNACRVGQAWRLS